MKPKTKGQRSLRWAVIVQDYFLIKKLKKRLGEKRPDKKTEGGPGPVSK